MERAAASRSDPQILSPAVCTGGPPSAFGPALRRANLLPRRSEQRLFTSASTSLPIHGADTAAPAWIRQAVRKWTLRATAPAESARASRASAARKERLRRASRGRRRK
eukprot:scaffold1424_cov237-Pinguiococcus_pyrenoidosus.AAC.9